jgi:hypothetical protein
VEAGQQFRVINDKLGQHILAISGEIRRPGLEGGKSGV